VVADHLRQVGWDVQESSVGAATDGQIDVRTVELALSTSASLLTTTSPLANQRALEAGLGIGKCRREASAAGSQLAHREAAHIGVCVH